MRWRLALSLQDLDRGEGVLLDTSPLDYFKSRGFEVVYEEDLGDRVRYILWNVGSEEELAVEERKHGRGMGGS